MGKAYLIDLNKMAVEVTKDEGGAISINIGQVKEVMGIVFTKMAKLTKDEVEDILVRYR